MITTSCAFLIARSTAQEAALENNLCLLGPAEKLACDGFRMAKRRHDWLAGRIAAKRVVLRYLARHGIALSAPEVEIINNSNGAPLTRLPEWVREISPTISISHNALGGVAALAEPDGLIGVDAEIIAPRSQALIEMMAHASEKTSELQSTMEQTRLWTLKEAVSKLLGVGLSVDLWDICFVPTEQGGRRILQLHGKARAKWQELGGPEISFESHISSQEVLSVARANSVLNELSFSGGTHG